MLLEGTPVHPYGSFWLDVADKAIKCAAVVVGGAWTYINFKRARTFQRKLEPKVSAQIFSIGPDAYLLVLCRLKNVGQSKYPIRQKGTGAEVVALRREGRERLSVSVVFDKHGWIEPGEEIDQSLVIPVIDPLKVVAFEVNLRVLSANEGDPDAIEWNASCLASAYFVPSMPKEEQPVAERTQTAVGPGSNAADKEKE